MDERCKGACVVEPEVEPKEGVRGQAVLRRVVDKWKGGISSEFAVTGDDHTSMSRTSKVAVMRNGNSG